MHIPHLTRTYKYIISLVLLLAGNYAKAQVTSQKIGNNPTIREASAVFEVESANKGTLLTRVALNSTIDNLLPIPAPVNGLTVFNTAIAGTAPNNVTPGYYFWSATNTRWVRVKDDISSTDWTLTGNTGTNPTNNYLGTSDAQDLSIRTSGTEKIRVTSGGNVGINTSNPQGIFHVDGAKDNPTTGVPTATQQSNDFVVSNTGSIGIGISSPSTKLHVNSSTPGAVRIVDGTQALGRIFVSDANGVGRWQAPVSGSWQGVWYNFTASTSSGFIGGQTFVRGTGGSVTVGSITVPTTGVYKLSAGIYGTWSSGTGKLNYEYLINGVVSGYVCDNNITVDDNSMFISTIQYLNLNAGDLVTFQKQFNQNQFSTISKGTIELALVN